MYTRSSSGIRRPAGFVLLLTLLFTATAPAAPPAPYDLGGRVEARVGDRTVAFPVLKTDIDADIQGDLATVTVIQTFANPLNSPMNATYLFPLNEDAAVYEMIMEVGDEVVRAQIKRVEEARQTFVQAQREGKSAALLTQHRPNMFTQDIANLMPGLPIRVTLRYVQTVPRVDGAYELVVPLVVGPRFQPPGAGMPAPAGPTDINGHESNAGPVAVEAGSGGVPRWNLQDPPPVAGGATGAAGQGPFGRWELEQLPAYPPVSGMELPGQIDPDRVGLRVRLDGGMPVADVRSLTHAIQDTAEDPQRRVIALAAGRTIDNRDFVLRYQLAGAASQAGLLAYRDERGGFFSLLIEPPAVPAEADITPRELVFLLDCSGSMAGVPINASKAFMRRALAQLRPTDSFRIIRFSDTATEFSVQPLPATPANIRQGLAYTEQLQGEGGTLMTRGIVQALQPPIPAGSLRLVVFLTDGYIGNEAEVLQLVQQHAGPARLYAFGVGTAVNRYLLSELGRVGRGFTRYLDPTAEALESVAEALAGRLQSPVLTDIRIDWGELAPMDLSPTRIPDLFAGQSLRLQGRYAKPGEYVVRIEGLVNGRRASLPLQVRLPESSGHGAGVALVWARSAVAEAMHQLITPSLLREGGAGDDDLKARVVKLGLDFSLVTQWTALVAVSEKIYNSTLATAPTLPVSVPQVAGVNPSAYGNPVAPPPAGGMVVAFGGNAAPEPAAVLGLIVMMLLLGGFAWPLVCEEYRRSATTAEHHPCSRNQRMIFSVVAASKSAP